MDFAGLPGVAVVAGGSGGIGAEVCRLLAERGSDVALTYHRNTDGAAAALAAVTAGGRRGLARQLTLEGELATAAFLTEVVAEFDAVHTLVVASGPHVPQTYLSSVGAADFRRQVEGEVVAFVRGPAHARGGPVTATPLPPPASSTQPPGPPGFGRALRAEWTKFRTLRGWVLAVLVGLALIDAVVIWPPDRW